MLKPDHYRHIVNTCEVMAEDIDTRFSSDVGVLTVTTHYDAATGKAQYYFQSSGDSNILEMGMSMAMEDHPELVLLLSNAVHAGDASKIMQNFEEFMLDNLNETDFNNDISDDPFGDL